MRATAARTIVMSGIAIGALALSGCSTGGDDAAGPQGASSTSDTTTCPTPESGANAQDTASYRMVMSAGDPETMVTQQEADAQGLTEGELIMGGGMDMGSQTNANGHVEVALCDLATGRTVQGADVMMEVVSGGSASAMMVMEMRGLDEPATESHYGNNIMMPSTDYQMRVTMNSESAEFPMTAAQ
jgi:hypothetical protein